jgi:starvation-inducible DNA-binding protein
LQSEAVKGTAVVNIVEKDFLSMLKQSREILALAEIAGDQGTVDLMAGFISRYEKTLWMLRAYKA